MNERCAKCGSDKIVPDVGVLDQGDGSDGYLRAMVEKTHRRTPVILGHGPAWA